MTLHAVFHEAEHATTVAARLRADGFAAQVRRERFAGEDDDEDLAWTVLTDAPAYVVEVLVEEFDGWLDADEDPAVPPAPLELPDAPRRVKGHWSGQ